MATAEAEEIIPFQFHFQNGYSGNPTVRCSREKGQSDRNALGKRCCITFNQHVYYQIDALQIQKKSVPSCIKPARFDVIRIMKLENFQTACDKIIGSPPDAHKIRNK